jgi:hypothetical protein
MTAPIIKQVLDGVKLNPLAKASGVSHTCLSDWRLGKSQPGLLAFEAVANAAGYELKLVPKGSDNEVP